MSDEKNSVPEEKGTYTDLSVHDSENRIPLNFDYYKTTDHSDSKRRAMLIAGCLLFSVCLFGAMKTLGEKTSQSKEVSAVSQSDAYKDSPYAYDTQHISENMTSNGLYYTEYAEHVRITGYRDILFPYDLTIPAFINNKPVTEVDYYVFSYSVLKSLTVSDPQCIFFEDASTPPVDTKVTIIAREDSKAHEMAEKYGNPFYAR
ncbi:MAG: hypothetical protein IJ779_05865 [Ruminococcus sp.]|nr:hypothetical protein [Ruminococcus sp.]